MVLDYHVPSKATGPGETRYSLGEYSGGRQALGGIELSQIESHDYSVKKLPESGTTMK